LFFIMYFWGVRCLKCSTVHNSAALSPAKLPQGFFGFRQPEKSFIRSIPLAPQLPEQQFTMQGL